MRGLGNDEAARSGFADRDRMGCAEFTDALEMTEEIDNITFRACKRDQSRRPDGGSFWTEERFAAFCFDELQSNGFDLGARSMAWTPRE